MLKHLSLAALGAMVAVPLLLAPASANAAWRGHWHGGWGWGWGVGLGLGLGLAYDAAYWGGYPYYGYPYYSYAPATTIVQTTPVMQAQPAPAAAVPSYYYCSKPQGYYPAVTACQVPWQAVPTIPPAR